MEYDYAAADGLMRSCNVYEAVRGDELHVERWTENAATWVEEVGERERVYHCSHGAAESPVNFNNLGLSSRVWCPRGDLNPTDHGSLTSEYARKPIAERDSSVLDVPQDSSMLPPLGLKAQRLSRSVSGPPRAIWAGRSSLSVGSMTTCPTTLRAFSG